MTASSAQVVCEGVAEGEVCVGSADESSAGKYERML